MKNYLIRLLLFFSFLNLSAQTVSVNFLQTGDGCTNLFNCLAKKSNGDIYTFFRDGSSANSNEIYNLMKVESNNTFTLVSTISMATLSGQTPFNSTSDDVSLVIDLNGGFHVAFRATQNAACCNQARGVVYGYSANGTSWSLRALQSLVHDSGSLNTDDPTIKLDLNNKPHIIYRYNDSSGTVNRYYAIEHRWIDTNGTWQMETVASSSVGLSNDITRPDFDISSNGDLHVACVRETNGSGTDGSLWYATKTASGSSWTATTLLTGATGAAASSSVSLHVLPNNKVSIINQGNGAAGAITEMTNESGTWVNSPIGEGIAGSINLHSFSVNATGDKLFGYKLGGDANSYYYSIKKVGETTWTIGNTIYSDSNNNVARYYSTIITDSRKILTIFDRLPNGGSCGVSNERSLWAANLQLPSSNSAPSDLALTSTSINENVANNSTVGTLSSTDSDSGNTFTYSLVAGTGDTDNAAFNISGGNLQFTSIPDYETKATYFVRIRTEDQGGLTFEKAFTIVITNANEAPSNLLLSATSINENVANNSIVGSLSSTDVDSGSTFTYSLVAGSGDTDNAAFNISGGNLQITSSPDFETKNLYSVRIRTADQGGLIYEKAFAISINNLNEAPSNLLLSATSINENVANNSIVGSLSSTDVDSGNTFTYSLVAGSGDTDNAAFNISGGNLQITSSPDFETKNSYSVRIRTADQGGLIYEKAFAIAINNLEDTLLISYSSTNVSCFGSSDGTASVTVTGGVSPYYYNWSPTNYSTSSVSGLAAGYHTCTVTDFNGNTENHVFTITQPSALPEIVTTQTACDSYTWAVNGTTYTNSGTYISVVDCQTETLNLTITPSTSNTTNETACDSYTWAVNGTTYTDSGTYISVVDCNTETLNLTITPGTSNTTTETACDSYTWAVNGTTYTDSGTYTSVTDCHTETLELTISPSTPNTTTITACDTYTWSVNGTTYTASGVYTSVTGCNTETLELTIEPSTSNTTTASACDTYTWSVNGQTYTDSGTYTSVVGCHTETLNLSLARTSIFTPSMAIATYGDVGSPGGEQYFNVIDNDVDTKFLDFDSYDGTGFTVDLGGITKIATSISVTTANDAEGRDPKNYEVLGSNDGTNFTSIATGVIECNSNRLYTRNYYFVNNTAYGYYRINFTNTCSEGSEFQLSEVQLYSTSTSGLGGPIVFTTQPTSTSICNKYGSVDLTAAIIPVAGATYQWKVQTATGTTWENVNNSSPHYSGATTPILHIQQATAAMNNNSYKLVVTASSSCSSVVSSDTCVLTVNPLPNGAVISGGGTICENSSKTLRIANTLVGSVQWQISTTDTTTGFTDIEGATGNTYTTDPLTATTYYRVVISSGVCISKTSLALTVTVIPAPVAGTISGGNVTVCAYATSGRDLSGTETPFSNNTLLTVAGTTDAILWQKSTNYENATGATPVWTSALSTTNELTVTDLTVDTWFRVLVSNGTCTTPSEVVKITVTKVARAGVINSYSNGIVNSAYVCTGGDITFTSSAYTGSEIKWEVSTTSATSGFEAIAGENGQTFTMNTGAYAPLTSIYVRSVVRSGDCSTAISGFRKITISPQSVAGTVTGGGIICPGANRSVTVSGYTGAIQWQSSFDGINYVNVPTGLGTAGVSYTSSSDTGIKATYLVSNITASTYFRAKITSGLCSEVYSNSVQFTIGTAVAGTLTAANPTVCKGTGTTLTLTGSVGAIKWWKSTNWTSQEPQWIPLSSTAATVLTGNLSVATAYKAEVTVGACSTVTSQIMSVMVFAAPLAKTITANVTTPSGTSSASAICNTSTSKVLIIGGGSIGAIQWQKSITSATSGFVDIADAIAMSYAITNPTVGANYFRAKFTNSCGVSVFSSAITVHYKECAPGKAITSVLTGKTPFAVVSYPNPFSNNFNLDVTSSSSEKVSVVVYDMIGRVLEKHLENVSEINSLAIGTNYPAGVYNVIVTQGLEVKTVRVIKK